MDAPLKIVYNLLKKLIRNDVIKVLKEVLISKLERRNQLFILQNNFQFNHFQISINIHEDCQPLWSLNVLWTLKNVMKSMLHNNDTIYRKLGRTWVEFEWNEDETERKYIGRVLSVLSLPRMAYAHLEFVSHNSSIHWFRNVAGLFSPRPWRHRITVGDLMRCKVVKINSWTLKSLNSRRMSIICLQTLLLPRFSPFRSNPSKTYVPK